MGRTLRQTAFWTLAFAAFSPLVASSGGPLPAEGGKGGPPSRWEGARQKAGDPHIIASIVERDMWETRFRPDTPRVAVLSDGRVFWLSDASDVLPVYRHSRLGGPAWDGLKKSLKLDKPFLKLKDRYNIAPTRFYLPFIFLTIADKKNFKTIVVYGFEPKGYRATDPRPPLKYKSPDVLPPEFGRLYSALTGLENAGDPVWEPDRVELVLFRLDGGRGGRPADWPDAWAGFFSRAPSPEDGEAHGVVPGVMWAGVRAFLKSIQPAPVVRFAGSVWRVACRPVIPGSVIDQTTR